MVTKIFLAKIWGSWMSGLIFLRLLSVFGRNNGRVKIKMHQKSHFLTIFVKIWDLQKNFGIHGVTKSAQKCEIMLCGVKTNLDNFLYREVGYEKIRNISSNMFLGAYSVTSLSEYFATSFENYYLNNRKVLLDQIRKEYKIISKGDKK